MRVYLEVGRKTFASAADWPGWSRSGKTEDQALDHLLAYGERYARAVAIPLDSLSPLTRAAVEIVERLEGNATTDFGAPGVMPELDQKPLSAKRLDEMIALLHASWHTFGQVAASARARTLGPSGPRGGGRTLAKMIAHVTEAQAAYINAIGGKWREGAPWEETKHEFSALLGPRARGELPDVGPRGGKRWPAPYAIRRSAWHALDHAWEIEDRLG